MGNFNDLMVATGSEKNTINYKASEEASGLGTRAITPAPPVYNPMGGMGKTDMASGTMVKSVTGAKVDALPMETANVRGRMNSVIQFSINNTGNGAANQKVRIGSVAAFPDSYARFGLTAGSADNAVIVDDFGAGCLKVQGFSDLCNFKPVVVSEIHIISDDLTQLNASFLHRLIHPDMVVDNRSNNLAFTQQKTDQKATLNVAKGKWMIDSNQFLEFTSYAGKSVTILLHLVAIANVAIFTPTE